MRIAGKRRLRYLEGADPVLDRPGHVRAASAIVAVGRGHLVVQDDALFLAALDADEVRAVMLPSGDAIRQFDDLRGNKAAKPDLEAACRWGDAILGFGSGSTPRRERVLIVTPGAAPRLVEAGALYERLRALLPDAELNLEGAWHMAGGALRLLQRGNGAGGVDAVIDVDGAWVDELIAGRVTEPVVRSWARWDLGELGGVRLTFTDGLALDPDRWLFSAAAEASPDAIADGPVAGSVVGWATDAGGAWAPLPLPCKLEGIARSGTGLVGVVDPDDPARPAELLELRLEGPWAR